MVDIRPTINIWQKIDLYIFLEFGRYIQGPKKISTRMSGKFIHVFEGKYDAATKTEKLCHILYILLSVHQKTKQGVANKGCSCNNAKRGCKSLRHTHGLYRANWKVPGCYSIDTELKHVWRWYKGYVVGVGAQILFLLVKPHRLSWIMAVTRYFWYFFLIFLFEFNWPLKYSLFSSPRFS